MGLKFGTSGIRGLVCDFTDKQVYLLTSAFLKYADSLGLTTTVSTGEDLRTSSAKIAIAVHVALFDNNKKIYSCSQISTPSLAFFSQKNNSLAIMITGSHIPSDRNGIKFYLESGETLKKDDKAIFEIYQNLQASHYMEHLFNNDESFIKIPSYLTNDSMEEANNLYVRRYLDFFKNTNLNPLRIIFYEHSSVSRDIIPLILEKLGATVIRLGRSNTFIPVDTEAVESLSQFQKWIKEHNADGLLSTDGDGDRPLIIDNNGQLIQGDKIGMITSLVLGIEAVALPITCNSGISTIQSIKEIIFTKIGSPFVIEALNSLKKKYSRIGGFEANGGFILKSNIEENNLFLHCLPTRDCVLPIISVLSEANRRKISLSELTLQLPQRFTASILIKNCKNEISLKILEQVNLNQSEIISQIVKNKTNILEVNKLDGLRIRTSNEDIIHFRPSGNAPEFRCYTESDSQEKANLLAYSAQCYLESLIQELKSLN